MSTLSNVERKKKKSDLQAFILQRKSCKLLEMNKCLGHFIHITLAHTLKNLKHAQFHISTMQQLALILAVCNNKNNNIKIFLQLSIVYPTNISFAQ